MKIMKVKLDRSGSALMIVICLAAILLITAGSFMRMAGQMAHTVNNFRRGSQALSIAEAGVSDIIQKLSTSFSTYRTYTLNQSYNGGSYVVNVTTNGKSGAIIRSTGTYQGVSRETILEVLGDWESGWSTNLFKDMGILADGLIDNNGNGVLHAGLHSNTSVQIAPNVLVEGSVSTVGTVTQQGTVLGETNEHAASIKVPGAEWSYYTNICLSFGGDFYSGDQTFKELQAPASGVICVLGDVKIQNGAIIQGAIIATGDIIMTGGQIDHIAVSDPFTGRTLPSLASTTGDIKVNGGQTLNGPIFAAGNVEINGGDTVWGGIYAGGVVDARGNWQVYPGDGTIPPGITPSDQGEVTGLRVGGWLQ